MVSLRYNSISIGAIFEYPNPIDLPLLIEEFEDSDRYAARAGGGRRPEEDASNLIAEGEISARRLAISPGGVVLYNSDTSIAGFGNCAVLLVKSRGYPEFDDIVSLAQDVYGLIDELEMAEQLSVFELIVNSRARLQESYQLESLLSDDLLSLLEDETGTPAIGQTVQIKGDTETVSEDWYRLNIDTTENKNPLFWGITHQKRYTELDAIEEEELVSDIDTVIESTNTEVDW